MDPIQFGKQIAALVRDLVEKSVAGLRQELKSLEDRIAGLPEPKSVTAEDLRPLVADAVKEAVKQLPAPKDGESVTVDQVLPAVLAEMRAAVAGLPKPADGKSVTLEDVRPLVEEAVKALPPAEPGAAGTSVTVEQVLPDLQAQVKAHLDALPVPQDGKSVTVEEVVQALLPSLERTLAASVDRWALDFERRAQDTLQRAVERIPTPTPGKDGVDGFNLEDFTANFDGERTLTLSFKRGDLAKSAALVLPVPIHRGAFDESRDYAHGDGVTFGGHLWIAEKDAPEGKPGLSADWRLAVKRGRDGSRGRDVLPPAPSTVKLHG